MKPILPLLLLPALAVAQQGQPPQAKQQSFAEFKQQMVPMIEKSLPAMQQTLQCVQASGNSQQLQQCAQQMVDFQRQMAIASGVPAEQVPAPPPEAMQLEWSEEIKARIVADTGRAIERAKATLACLGSSSDGQQMGHCMQQAAGAATR